MAQIQPNDRFGFIDTDAVKANREKNAAQWETFTKYLESKGKLKK